MNKTELKSTHPELYSEVLAEGIKSEQDRVASWMAYNEADPKAVAEGVKSGEAISTAQSHEFLVAIAQKGMVNNLQADNAKPIVVAETETVEGAEKTADEIALENSMKFTLK